MSRFVRWSSQADADVKEILSYIASDNEPAAIRVVQHICQTAEKLGERSLGRPGRVEGTYEKIVAGLPYIICYEIDVDAFGNERVIILHVIHMSRNWLSGSFPH